MTFEQFQTTRKQSTNLFIDCDSFANSTDGDTPQPGNTYLDKSLYIEEVQDWWPNNVRDEGRWHLLLERSEYISDDLESLERQLYEFAQSAGYFE